MLVRWSDWIAASQLDWFEKRAGYDGDFEWRTGESGWLVAEPQTEKSANQVNQPTIHVNTIGKVKSVEQTTSQLMTNYV